MTGARTALIGGATSGLGLASAHALAARGMRLLLWSRDEDRLAGAAAELRAAHGVEVSVVAADAAAPDAAATVAAQALASGGVDVVVLNAGGPPPVGAEATDPDAWRTSFQLLALTPIELATLLLPGMRQRGFGRLIAVLSSGIREPIDALAYSNACRSALRAWMKTVSRAVAADGVTVNGVLPGRIATPRVAALDAATARRTGTPVEQVRSRSEASIPAGRYGRPEEFAAAVDFLAGEQAGYVTGTTITVDGGSMHGFE